MISDLELDIEAGKITALVTEDVVSSQVLQVMGGFRAAAQGEVVYPCVDSDGASPKWLQYVPDDIICYYHLKVKDYLHGVAMTAAEDITEECDRLCDLFDVDVEEELLDLTFEQNRLVAMIQALVYKPKLLLLDRPNDMLGRRAYRLLWEELHTLQKQGATIVLAIDSYEDIVVPCDRYLFFREGELEYDLLREDLPLPAKVVTLEGGSVEPMDPEKREILYEEGVQCRFLYWEEDRKELALRIAETSCRNFFVEELSMEEEIFEDYERWML